MKLYAKENFSRKNCYNKAIKHEQQARSRTWAGFGFSKQGYNPGLVQNFNSAMKTLKANSVLFFVHNLMILYAKRN